jgi:hypothetical protein
MGDTVRLVQLWIAGTRVSLLGESAVAPSDFRPKSDGKITASEFLNLEGIKSNRGYRPS